jgi:hypothetical protein
MKPTCRQAIDAFCLRCQQQDVFAVANCPTVECPLYLVRPNQLLMGKGVDDFDAETCVQAVEDALAFPGLKEHGLEYL